MTRPSGRAPDELRAISISRQYTKHAEGSVLVEFGDTKLICTATVEDKVPAFLRGQEKGWVTAEYGMLPRSTGSRMGREAARGRQSGRTLEIQRLIGRALRAVVDRKALGEHTVTVDCDVIQADGGTRTAAITGAFVALSDATTWMQMQKKIHSNPLDGQVAAVSVGLYRDQVVLDLDYAEDREAQTDMNLVMDGDGNFVEIQGTAEDKPFNMSQLLEMTDYGKRGVAQLIDYQRSLLCAQ